MQIKNELQSKIEKIEAEVISSPATRELFDQKDAELLYNAQIEKAVKDAQESGNSSTARQTYKDNLIKVTEFLNKNLNKFLYYSI
ncbi:hypothetical protein [Mycoplasmopsis arginini]|uniref:Uncharacterized protein n=1 Tax=Mycoplasmopsis arginini TaxID=2094 RepID=A0AA43QWZ9_MYCAR|nr:hypothetical protein [Mycoplasmopsis arginini]ENY69852.1 Hypothetical protein MARG_2050 [Mycoplasmopsis arginini 7264]MDI3348346.1 hypothetical protein [Mycoplasmopsis arginini]MDI3348962.1 hypothetical protein [Mycoplasmopsis arginini]MDI3349730.1 hypothetical protein [Mycoplasmopsis arginini]